MPQQLSYPGVYIQEVPSGVRTITSVATSIAAFFGRADKGPMNKAIRIQSLADFDRKFGAPQSKSDLAYSVRQFFGNGGTDCYVVRLASGALTANVTLQDIDTNNILTLSAKSAGSWGNNIRFEIDYGTTNPDETFNLIIVQEEAGNEVKREVVTGISMDPESNRFAPDFITQSSDLVSATLHADANIGGVADIHDPANSFAGFSQSRLFKTTPIGGFRTEFHTLLTASPNLQINVDDRGYLPIDLSSVFGAAVPAIDPASTWTLAEMKNRLAVVINEQLNAVALDLKVACSWKTSGDYSAMRISSDAAQKKSVHIRRGDSADFAVPMMLGIDQGGIETVRNSNFRPVPTAAFYQDIDELIKLGGLGRDDITSISIDGEVAISFDFSNKTPLATDPWFLDSSGNADGIREKLRIISEAVNSASGSKWKAELWGYHLAFVAKEGGVNKIPSSVTSVTNTHLGGTKFTRNVRRYTLGNTGTSGFQQTIPKGQAGTNGTAPTESEFIGSENSQTGFHALDSVDLFNLMIIPGDEEIDEAIYSKIWGPASTYCASHRAFLLVDAPVSWTKNNRPEVKSNTGEINNLRASLVKDHAAVFYPRLEYSRGGLTKKIGPGGAIAGLMSRTDAARGVWKAPAGIEAGIRNILGVELELTDAENGVLNKKGVNCIRVFPNGIVNWGSRTLDGDDDFGSEWKYIPVRRLALMIEESLFRGTKWVVFEPNDEPLWSKIRMNIGSYMQSLFRQGAFQGTAPKDAYFVKCDKETTTQDDINKGIVNIQVGFAPLKPAEFVVISIQQIAGDV
ncbi:MAG: hypothetical protein GY819_13050 [Planctomycetaceae bacterium]|nr:hypothetical protein [Planctomycetaceae bacterium]